MTSALRGPSPRWPCPLAEPSIPRAGREPSFPLASSLAACPGVGEKTPRPGCPARALAPLPPFPAASPPPATHSPPCATHTTPSPSGCVRDIIIMATRAAAWNRGARVIPGGGGSGGSTSTTAESARASLLLPLAGCS